jgi:proline dehydrogenase
MLRSAILAAARNARVEQLISGAPLTRDVVRRFVGGPDTAAAIAVTRSLLDAGLTVSLDHLGEDTTDLDRARSAVDAYLELLTGLHRAGLTDLIGVSTARVEVSVKLSAIGQSLPSDGEKISLEHARTIAYAAKAVGATMTLDMEDHTTTDATLTVLRELRPDFPDVGAVLQSQLRRTEADCRELAGPASRVRLCKGAYDEPVSAAFRRRDEIDRSYVRCVNVLLAGSGYPMFATHDPRLIDIVGVRAADHSRPADTFEYQMLYGIRPNEQSRLTAAGNTVRVYVPYGAQWYGYLMRRLAERPANLTFFLRALASRR